MKTIINKLKNGLDLSPMEASLLIRVLEQLDPVYIKTDAYWKAPGSGTGPIEEAHVYSRQGAWELVGTRDDAQIISI